MGQLQFGHLLYGAILCTVAIYSTFSEYTRLYFGEFGRPLGLAMLATFWAALLYGIGKACCVLWSDAFGQTRLLLFVDRFVVAIPPALFLLFPPFVRGSSQPTLDPADVVLALLLFDFFGSMHLLVKTLGKDHLELSFLEIGLSYPPKSRLAAFTMMSIMFSVAVGVSFMVAAKT